MALLPKKTYSRRNNDVSFFNEKEKENVDPFDELLSSPLKQEVQFHPLSFWSSKVKHLQTKEKSRNVDCGLFGESDSDELNSATSRKRKPKTKQSQSKARTLQPKSTSQKLCGRRKNYSTAYSIIKKSKDPNPVLTNEREISMQFRKSKGWSRSSHLHQSEKLEETSLFNSNFTPLNQSQFDSAEGHLNETHAINNCRDCNNNVHSRDFKNSLPTNQEVIKPYNVSFQIYEDADVSQEQSRVIDDKTVILSNGSISNSFQFDRTTDETLTPFQSGHNSFMFVNTRRHFKYPYCSCAFYRESHSSNSFLNCSWPNECSGMEDITLSSEVLENTDETLINYDENPTPFSFNSEDSTDKTFCIESENVLPFENEELRDLFLLECQALENGNLEDDAVESSSTSEDTLSSFSQEETVIKIGLNPRTKDPTLTDSSVGKDTTNQLSPNAVSALTAEISDLSLADVSVKGISMDEENEKTGNFDDNSFHVDLRNITTKRRCVLNNKYENNTYNRLSVRKTRKSRETSVKGEMDLDQSVRFTGRTSLDFNQTISFANPVFESTRVFDMDSLDRKDRRSQWDITESFVQDRVYNLKPGKKWQRSISVLKQLQNGSIAGGRLESTRITGRKFESFVQDMLEIQNEKSEFFTTLVDTTSSNKTVLNTTQQSRHFPGRRITVLDNTHLENSVVDGSVSSISLSNNTLLEKSSLNFTVKVIEPETEPSAFRSALGVDSNRSISQKDSVQEKSSAISPRDFILMQCGQEDVLPFEAYFNEKTLKNCRKIGEGVYGEVFMSSDAVIKIIPIEGEDKVNGEPQKTFEEIMSEVVIASKLSNLRNGKKYRTDGFSELKRCWCVKGKYPKYLMQLWNEYDQAGSGSENDSPIMFKNDQLYIILELANGGKDLESYVFSSSAQSLSLFVQIAFSLAAAEKAFEFEHRDLHWGNVLISDTKDKFTAVTLDGIEYKIPTKGVKVCIIDFTLSRINHEGCCVFNDLSVDPSLFASEGDYQFEIYRLMLREVKNDWSLFRPKTNLFWLHYTVDKMIKMVRYRNKKGKIHAKHLQDLKKLECAVLGHKDSTDFVLSKFIVDVVNKL